MKRRGRQAKLHQQWYKIILSWVIFWYHTDNEDWKGLSLKDVGEIFNCIDKTNIYKEIIFIYQLNIILQNISKRSPLSILNKVSSSFYQHLAFTCITNTNITYTRKPAIQLKPGPVGQQGGWGSRTHSHKTIAVHLLNI